MNFELAYLVCFVLGLTLTALAGLGAFSHLHLGHFPGHFPGHAAHGLGGKGGIGPLNGFTIAAFLCWFGGCGFLLTRYGGLIGGLVLLLAIIAGFTGGALLFWFLSRVLAHERALTPADTEMQGVLGSVTSEIRPEGVGEIQFSQNGARRFAPARSEEGVAIPRDVEVVVLRYERGIAYVRRWEDLAAGWNDPSFRSAALPQNLNH